MFQELKKKTLKKSLAFSIILILAGAGLAGYMATSMYYVIFGYADFVQLKPEEIKNQLVEFDMTTNFGCYLEEYEYNTNNPSSRKTTDLYYIVWTGDDYAEDYRYMTVKVPANYETRMEKMADNTYNDIVSDAITVRGRIRKLSDEEYDYFVEFFEEAGWSAEDIEDGTLPYYIDCYSDNATMDGAYIFIFLGGLVLLVWGIVRVVKAATGAYVKKFKKDIADAGYSESVIESDYRNASSLHKKSFIKIGRLMTYYIAGSEVRAIPNNKMMWAYLNTITHRRNGIKTGVEYNVIIEAEGAKKAHTVSVPSEATAKDMLQKMNDMFPWIVLGYSEELKALFRNNRDQFLALRYNTCEHIAVEPGFEEYAQTNQ